MFNLAAVAFATLIALASGAAEAKRYTLYFEGVADAGEYFNIPNSSHVGKPFNGYITWDAAAGARTDQDETSSNQRTIGGCRGWTNGVCTLDGTAEFQRVRDPLPKASDVIDYLFSWSGGDVKPLDGNPADEAQLYEVRYPGNPPWFAAREEWMASRTQQEFSDTVESSAFRDQRLFVSFQSFTYGVIFDKPDVSDRPNLTMDSNPRLQISSSANTHACSNPDPWNRRCVVNWVDPDAFYIEGPLTSVTIIEGKPVELPEPVFDFMSMLLLFWAWPWER